MIFCLLYTWCDCARVCCCVNILCDWSLRTCLTQRVNAGLRIFIPRGARYRWRANAPVCRTYRSAAHALPHRLFTCLMPATVASPPSCLSAISSPLQRLSPASYRAFTGLCTTALLIFITFLRFSLFLTPRRLYCLFLPARLLCLLRYLPPYTPHSPTRYLRPYTRPTAPHPPHGSRTLPHRPHYRYTPTAGPHLQPHPHHHTPHHPHHAHYYPHHCGCWMVEVPLDVMIGCRCHSVE